MRLSRMPPVWDATGGLKAQYIRRTESLDVMAESVVNEFAISRCTFRTVKQVNITLNPSAINF